MEDLTTILKRDHRNLDAKLAELSEADDSEQEAMVDEIEAAFERHATLEEELLYPHLADELGEEPAEEAQTEHDLARKGFEQLRELAGQPGFGAMVDMLRAGIKHHVQEEEKELLPQLKKRLDSDVWKEIATEAAESQEQADEGAGAKAPARSKK